MPTTLFQSTNNERHQPRQIPSEILLLFANLVLLERADITGLTEIRCSFPGFPAAVRDWMLDLEYFVDA